MSVGSYPKELHFKLYLRKGFSLKELGEVKLALEAFSTAEHLLEESELDSGKLIEVREIIQESKANIHERVSNTEAPVFKESQVFQLGKSKICYQ